jgi:hypothetical protein
LHRFAAKPVTKSRLYQSTIDVAGFARIQTGI